jgi:hypothetical protein
MGKLMIFLNDLKTNFSEKQSKKYLHVMARSKDFSLDQAPGDNFPYVFIN